MFSTAHLTSGIALGLALGLEGAPFLALVGASVLTDWDYAFQLATGRNHRTLLTHSPPVVAGALALAALWQPLLWWALAGSVLHFALDVWEYGIRLNPFSRRIYGFKLIPGIEDMRFGEYWRTYWRDARFFGAELAFASAALALAVLRLT